jgi:hypothetical protein
MTTEQTYHLTTQGTTHTRNLDQPGQEEEVICRYRVLIHDRVGQEFQTMPEMKSLRVSAPEKYSGEDDIETFNTWVTGLLRWYWVHNITRTTKDSVRVDLCKTTLKGAASEWYSDEVEAWNRPN